MKALWARLFGPKVEKPFISKDKQNLNNFYDFKITEEKLEQAYKRSNKQMKRYFITSIFASFCWEYILLFYGSYDSMITRATLRRLSNNLLIQKRRKKKMTRSH